MGTDGDASCLLCDLEHVGVRQRDIPHIKMLKEPGANTVYEDVPDVRLHFNPTQDRDAILSSQH
jgi:hypothetical protein